MVLNYHIKLFLNVVGTALHLALGEAACGKGFTNVNSCVLICINWKLNATVSPCRPRPSPIVISKRTQFLNIFSIIFNLFFQAIDQPFIRFHRSKNQLPSHQLYEHPSALRVLDAKPDTVDRLWGLCKGDRNGTHKWVNPKLLHMLKSSGKRIITPSGRVGPYNPTKFSKTKFMVFGGGSNFQVDYSFGEVQYTPRSRVQAYFPKGKNLRPVQGPEPRYQRPNKIARVEKRNFERFIFGELEQTWVEKHLTPNIVAGFDVGQSEIISINCYLVRKDPWLKALKQNLAPKCPRPVRQRFRWTTPCVNSHKKLILGDSMVARLPDNAGYKLAAYPGADIRFGSRSFHDLLLIA